ncbi:hypothetical protein HUJ05_005242 [Dendroctonus ponderosae]|nr:hypothetical protein HUJ05_005242 [Dendroctonus ponderosae]
MPMTPIAEKEDDLQRLLHSFYVKAKTFYMQVSTRKTNALVTSKEPMRCLANETIEQVITGVEEALTGPYITKKEIIKAGKQLKNIKAVGEENIPSEIIKRVIPITKVEECTNDETGVGAAIAAESHEENLKSELF